VNTIDPDFKNPKYLKATLGFDHRFSNGIVSTIEGLYSRSQNNAFYRNLVLPANPVAQDSRGRQLYGVRARALEQHPSRDHRREQKVRHDRRAERRVFVADRDHCAARGEGLTR